jgi:hypothetical protein
MGQMSWIPNPYLHGELVVVIDCADLAVGLS